MEYPSNATSSTIAAIGYYPYNIGQNQYRAVIGSVDKRRIIVREGLYNG